MKDYIKLTQDNHDKLSVYAPIYVVEQTAKDVLGWRTPTNRYKSILDRLQHTGSSQYDRVINALHIKGF